MISVAIIAVIAVAGLGNALAHRHAVHPGVEPWRTG
jgi:hypothetical protein